MSYRYRIRVHYPSEAGAIVLRTDRDWEEALEPTKTVGPTRIFELRRSQPFFYFKPCLLQEDGFRWSGGANYLAVADEADSEDVYPRFFTDGNGTVTRLLPRRPPQREVLGHSQPHPVPVLLRQAAAVPGPVVRLPCYDRTTGLRQ